MSYIIQLRRGIASEWTTDNPVLRQGEPGFELFTGKFKIGDGIQHWNDLPYFLAEDLIVDIITTAIADIVLAAGVTINDLSTTSTTETYSVSKIKSLNDAQNIVIAGKALESHQHTLDDITNASDKAEDSAVVKLTGAQSISGVKTFISSPVIPNNSFSIAKITGLQVELDAKTVIADGSATNATTTTYSANKINLAIATAVANLIGTAPSVLDTLGEISDALNDDASAVATLVTALAGKQPLDSDLTTISGLTATTDSFLQAKAGAWAARTIAQVKTDLGLTGTNSGDQSSIVGITGTKSQFNAAVTDGDIVYVGDITSFTDEAAQDAVGAMVVDTDTIDLTYTDATPAFKGDVRTQLSITSDASGIKLSGDSATPGNSKLYGTDASGVKGWHAQPAGVGVTDGDKGDITVSGSGTVWSIDNDVVTYAKMQNVSATSKILGRITTGAGDVEELSAANVKTIIGVSGTNTGDQTSIVGISGTKSQFNTAVTDGDILFVGDVADSGTVINVKAAPYNATGNGTTNDRTVLGDAFDDAVSGDTVYFPGGDDSDYLITSTLTVPDGVRVIADPGARLFGNFSGNILNVGSDVTVDGLTVENQHTETIDVNITANATNVRLYRLTLKGLGHGVYAGSSGCSNIKVIDCTFLNDAYGWLSNGGTGTMAWDLRDVTIDNCRFNVQADAIEFNHPTTADAVAGGFTIVNCSITVPDLAVDAPSSGFGIGLANVRDCLIENNRLDQIRNQGIHIEDDCANILVVGNAVKGVDGTLASLPASQNVGISIAKSVNVTLIANHVESCRGNGIEMIFNGTLINDHLTVTNNSVTDCDSGFSLYGTPPGGHIIVSNNRAFGNADNGFEIGGQAATQVIGNQAFNNGGWGIYRPGGNEGYLSNYRENILYGNTTGDINGAVIASGGPTVLYDRSVQLSGTTGGGGTGLGYPGAFRLGEWAQGRVHISVRTGSYRMEKTEDVTWDGTTFKTATVRSDGYGVIDTKCHSMVNGVMAIEVYTATNQDYRATVRFDGLIFETSATFSGTVAATALTTGTGVSDGDKGDITVASSGTSWTIDSNVVTYAKIQDVSATNRILGRITTGAGDPEELTGANVRTIAGLATGDSPQFTGIELGHATDTTLTRSAAGVLAVEGVVIPTVSSTSTLTNKTLTSPVINTPTGIAKGDVGLGNVDNTSDATKNAATATLTNKTLTSPVINTPTGIAKADISGLGTADSPQFAGIELGHATDTTIARVSAGVVSVEGKNVALNGTSEVYTVGTVELGHASDTTIARVSAGVVSVEGKNVALNGTSEALTTGSIELGNASDTTLSRSAAGILAVEGVAVPTISGATTLTNKRVTPRTGTTTSSATPTINTDNIDFYSITALAVNITSFTTNLSGTPTDGQKLWIAITGTAARTIAWGTSFEASTVPLPTTTVTTNRLDVGFVWNAVTSKWRCVAVV